MKESSKGLLRAVLRWLALGAIVVLFVMAIFNSRSGIGSGVKVPPILGVNLHGERVALHDFKGRPAVINFWGTWCPPCRAELPEFERAYQQFGDKVDFYGIASESGGPKEVAEAVRRFGLTYPNIVPYPEVLQAFKVQSFPTTFIVGPDGRIAHTYSSSIDFDILQRDLKPYLD